MLNKLLFVLLVLTQCFTAIAQPICATDSLHEQRLRTDAKFRKEVEAANEKVRQYIQSGKLKTLRTTGSIYTIPVVVHVMHTGEPVGSIYNPSDEQIFAAIDYLNRVYNGTYPGTRGAGDLQVQFVLANYAPDGRCTNGIDRVDARILDGYEEQGVTAGYPIGVSEASLKNLSKWNVSDYYNIWVVNKIEGKDGTSGSFIAGYAYLPTGATYSLDGTVLLATYMKAGLSTLPHEIGHSLNLHHTFQGSAGPSCPASEPCASTGDYVCDTDPCTSSFSCRSGTNPCTGRLFDENTESNYMSYTDCYDLFTPGQKERILASFVLASRQSLARADNPAFAPCVYNDNCPGQVLQSDVTCNYLVNQSLRGATPSGRSAVSCDPFSNYQPQDVWYAFTAYTPSHTITIDPAGSSLQAVVSLYASCSDADVTPVGCAAATAPGVVTTLTVNNLEVGKTYYIRVYNAGGGTANKGFKICVTNPCATPGTPVDVSAAATGETSATFSWMPGMPPGSGTITYYWVVGTSPDVTYGNGVAWGQTTGTSISTQSLTCGATYYLRVYAAGNCDGKKSAYATSAPFTTAACKGTCVTPAAPTITNIQASQSAAHFTWSPVAGNGSITYYWVVGTNASVDWGKGISQGYTTETFADAIGLTCNSNYYLRVYASTDCDESTSAYQTQSFTTSGCVNSCPAPSAPAGVAITKNGSSVSGSWQGTGSGETYYWVVGTSPAVTFNNGVRQGSTMSNSVNLDKLTCGTTYYLRVFASNSCNGGMSSYATSASFTTDACTSCPVPVKPAEAKAVMISKLSAQLSWTPSNGAAANYYWVVGTTPSVTYGNGVAQGVTKNSTAIATLSCGSTYYLRVYAQSDCSSSSSGYATSIPFSTDTCDPVCTIPTMPTNLKANVLNENEVMLRWTPGPVNGNTPVEFIYWVFTDLENDWISRVADGRTFSDSVKVSALYCGGSYYFAVSAASDCDGSFTYGSLSPQFNTPACVPAGCNTPGVPQNITIIPASANTVTVTWDFGEPAGSSNMTYYFSVDKDPNKKFEDAQIHGYSHRRTAVVSVSDCNGPYYLKMYAQTDCNNTKSDTSAPVMFQLNCDDPCRTPESPANPVATVLSGSIARLSWDPPPKNSDQPIKYQWFLYSRKGDWNSRIATDLVDTTFAFVSNLECDKTYWFSVMAYVECNWTSSLQAASAVFGTERCSGGCITPGVPSAVKVTPVSNTRADFSWQKGSPPGSYNVSYYWVVGTSPDVSWGSGIDQGITTDTLATTTRINCTGQYYFRVFAFTDCDSSRSVYVTSEPFTCFNQCVTPSVPNAITIKKVNGNSVRVSWEPGDPAGTAPITYYYVVGTTPDVKLNSPSQISSGYRMGNYTLILLPNCDQPYYFRIFAKTDCNGSVSPYSNAVTITTDCSDTCVTPDHLKNIKASWLDSTSARIEWQSGGPYWKTDFTYNWRIVQKVNGVWGKTAAEGSTRSNSLIVGGLSCTEDYFLDVTAFDCDPSLWLVNPSFAFGTCAPTCETPAAPQFATISSTAGEAHLLSWQPGSPAGSNTITYYWVVGISPTVTYGNGVAQGQTTGISVSTNVLSCGTTYYLRVYAKSSCDNTESAYATSQTFTTSACAPTCVTPGLPISVTGISTSETSAVLSWQPGSPAGNDTLTYYWVVGTSPTVTYGNGVAQGQTTATSVNVGGLTCATTYYLRVYAKTSCDNKQSAYVTSQPFSTSTCAPACETPGPPVNVSGAPTSETSAVLSWQPGSNAGSNTITYYWVVGTSPAVTYGNGVAQGQTNGTTVTTGALSCGTTYYLMVYAQTSCDNTRSAYATSQPFTTSACGPVCVTPGLPIKVIPTVTGENSAKFTWSAGTPAGSGSIIYYWVVGKTTSVLYGQGIDQGSTTDTSAFTAALECETIYYLRVFASTDCNQSRSPYSTSGAFTTAQCPCVTPGAPTNLKLTPTSANTAKVSWGPGNPPGREVTYYWAVGKDSTVEYARGALTWGSTPLKSISFSSLICDQPYYFRVMALTGCDSSKSVYATYGPFKTDCADPCHSAGIPKNLHAQPTGENSVRLTWNAGDPVAGSDVYHWYVAARPEDFWVNEIVSGTSTSTSVEVSGLACGKLYYYRVFASTLCNGTSSSSAISPPFFTMACAGNCETPGAPVYPSASFIDSTTARLTWYSGLPAGSATVTYRWVVGTTPNVVYGQGVAQGSTTENSITTQALGCGLTYYLRVFAESACNQNPSAYATSSAFTNIYCPRECITPGQPQQLQVMANDASKANFSWQQGSPTGSDSITYHWVVGTSQNVVYGQGVDQGTTKNTFATTSKLSCNIKYYFRVFALTDCNNSSSGYATSETFSCTTECVTPAAPVNVSVTPVNSNSAMVNWQPGTPPGTPEIVYNVIVGTSPYIQLGSLAVVFTTASGGQSALVAVPDCGETYYVRVVAKTSCDLSTSSYSDPISFSTSCADPSVTPNNPINRTAKWIGENTLQLSWESGGPYWRTGFTYHWRVDHEQNRVWSLVASGTTTSTSVILNNMSCRDNYVFSVYAVDECNPSFWFYAPTGLIEPCGCNQPTAPSNLRTAGVDGSTATVSWESAVAAGATTISYYWVAGASADVLYGNGVAQGVTNDTVVNIVGLNCNSDYFFRAYAASNCSDTLSTYSAALSFKTTTNCVTAVPTIPGLEDVQVMPNPNNGAFFVKLSLANRKEVQFTLTDITGRDVFISPAYSVSGVFTKRIESAALTAGVYLLNIKIGKQFIIRRIVVAR
ncbi:MAG: fibronectin type III domain-containing protein [Flavisolibacter sp.]